MSALILIDSTTKQEVGRRPMDASERYILYHCCQDHELFTFAHRRFHIHTVAWRIPSEECVMTVSYHSDAPTDEPFAC